MHTLPHHCMLTLVHTPIKHKHGGGGGGGGEGGREGEREEGGVKSTSDCEVPSYSDTHH